MSSKLRLLVSACAVGALGACASVPTGPSVMVLPGTGKSFDQFRFDEANCRQFASAQIGGASAEAAATDSMVRSAALGTVVGAAAGAALGGSSNSAGAGAATGLLFGTAVGAGTSQASGYAAQRRYDAAFVQCMYSQGHRVPVYGQMISAPGPVPRAAQTPPPGTPPPPPPGTPPPPPPGTPPPPPPGVSR